MLPEEFAAKRLGRLKEADDELRDLVLAALSAWDGEGEFHSADLEEAVEVIWLEHFTAEAPRADYERFLPRFRQVLTDSLAKTSAPTQNPPLDYEVERITVFLGTLAVNDGTFRGTGARGGKFKRWTSMHDPSVRHAHAVMDGQVRAINEPFTVDGIDLQYPGQPVGPPEVWIQCRCVAQPAAAKGEANVSDTTMTLNDDFDSRSRSLTAAGAKADTGVGVFLIPAATDPIVAASSEPAHLTTVWLGDMNDLEQDTIDAIVDEVRAYAATLDGPVVVPTTERGALGDEGADVMFLEATDSLLALRDGLLAASPTITEVMNSVEQYDEWTPHVTLGYPETPAAGEYDGDAVSFDRVGLWIGPDQDDYPMGDAMSKPDAEKLAAARALVAAAVVPRDEETETEPIVSENDDIVDEMPVDEPEEGEELITEIPVHGVATLEGKATDDGRGFRLGALSIGRMPQPLGYEYVSGHGADTSHVAIVGRIDEYFTVPSSEHGEGVNEVRWRGVIMPGKEYGARAIESVVDGSYTGLSVIVDGVTVDVEEEREAMRARILADMEAGGEVGAALQASESMSPEDIETLIDTFVGDGTQPVTWFSKAQVRRFDMVPTGAFQDGYVALGHEFADEMTPDAIEAAATALSGCNCDMAIVASAGVPTIVDLTALTEEQRETYDKLTPEHQVVYAEEHDAVIASAFAPGTKDGPGWITHPVATSRIRRYWVSGKGAAKIAWGTPGDFNRCRNQLAKYVQKPEWLAGLCANMHKEAIGVWPGQEGGKHGHSLTASAATERAPLAVMASATSTDERNIYPAAAFAEPTDDRAFAMRIDREARTIQGYAAQWGSCHIGIAGTCQEAPRTSSDYSFFRKGVVDTDSGEQRVALITYGIGHAGQYASPAAATAHYDQTDAVRAYINIGENHMGIWYSGVLAPWVTDADIDALRAIGRVSGDWRSHTGRPEDLEMVGLVCVNTEGFQLAASAAIGIGALPKEDESVETVEGVVAVTASAGMTPLSTTDIAGIAIAAAERVVALQERSTLAASAAPARAIIAQHTLAAARAEISNATEK